MPDDPTRTKTLRLLLMIANLAIDLLLPTVVLLALTPTGLPTALLLSVGGHLVAGKAIGGSVTAREFRWRPALLVAALANAGMLGAYAVGLDVRLSLVVGALITGAIMVGDVVRTRSGGRTGHRLDGFALLVLVEVAAGVVLTSISGDPRFVLARASLYLGIGGIVVLATTWNAQPFILGVLKPVAAKGDPERAAAFDRTWERSQQFRRLYRMINASLGTVFVADAALRIVIIYRSPATDVLESSLTSQLPMIILLAVWFAICRGLIVPRAAKLLDAELAKRPAPTPRATTARSAPTPSP